MEWCIVIVERIKDTRAPFYRPPLPPHESDGVHPGILTLMKRCWAEEPAERPSFDEIARALKSINRGKSASFISSTVFTSCIQNCLWSVMFYLIDSFSD